MIPENQYVSYQGATFIKVKLKQGKWNWKDSSEISNTTIKATTRQHTTIYNQEIAYDPDSPQIIMIPGEDQVGMIHSITQNHNLDLRDITKAEVEKKFSKEAIEKFLEQYGKARVNNYEKQRKVEAAKDEVAQQQLLEAAKTVDSQAEEIKQLKKAVAKLEKKAGKNAKSNNVDNDVVGVEDNPTD